MHTWTRWTYDTVWVLLLAYERWQRCFVAQDVCLIGIWIGRCWDYCIITWATYMPGMSCMCGEEGCSSADMYVAVVIPCKRNQDYHDHTLQRSMRKARWKKLALILPSSSWALILPSSSSWVMHSLLDDNAPVCAASHLMNMRIHSVWMQCTKNVSLRTTWISSIAERGSSRWPEIWARILPQQKK